MRELDLLLARFVDAGLERLDAAGLDDLERLLEAPDQDILAWLYGASEPQAPELARSVRIVRRYVASGAEPMR